MQNHVIFPPTHNNIMRIIVFSHAHTSIMCIAIFLPSSYHKKTITNQKTIRRKEKHLQKTIKKTFQRGMDNLSCCFSFETTQGYNTT